MQIIWKTTSHECTQLVHGYLVPDDLRSRSLSVEVPAVSCSPRRAPGCATCRRSASPPPPSSGSCRPPWSCPGPSCWAGPPTWGGGSERWLPYWLAGWLSPNWRTRQLRPRAELVWWGLVVPVCLPPLSGQNNCPIRILIVLITLTTSLTSAGPGPPAADCLICYSNTPGVFTSFMTDNSW